MGRHDSRQKALGAHNTRTHTKVCSAAQQEPRVKTPPRGKCAAPLCRPRTSTAHHSAVRLCGASGSPPASNPYCPSIFLLSSPLLFLNQSRRAPLRPPLCFLLPRAPSHQPSPTVHRPSPIVHRAQPRPQALILRPPAWRRTDLISFLCMRAWARGMGLPFCPPDAAALSAVGCGLWVRNNSKPWLSRRIRRVQRGPAGPDDPPPHQGSLPPGAASLGFYFRPCSLPDLFPSCLPRSRLDASGAPCDVMSRLVHCPCPLGRSHGCRSTMSVPPSACQTLLHFTSPAGRGRGLDPGPLVVNQPLEPGRAWAMPSVECGAVGVQCSLLPLCSCSAC